MFIGISCRPERISKDSRSPTERRKAELLEQLDQKFENPDVHFELGQVYQAEEQWAEAEYHYNVALRFNPAHRPAQAAMVKGLIDIGNTAKAEQHAKDYINQVSGSAMASLQLADSFDKQGLDKYALASYQQALRTAPNSSEVNKQLGYYYLKKGDKAKAKDYLSRSFQINPNQPDVSGELGRLGIVVKIP
jgi:tetratricopeptide (TPR) repeat protein